MLTAMAEARTWSLQLSMVGISGPLPVQTETSPVRTNVFQVYRRVLPSTVSTPGLPETFAFVHSIILAKIVSAMSRLEMLSGEPVRVFSTPSLTP